MSRGLVGAGAVAVAIVWHAVVCAPDEGSGERSAEGRAKRCWLKGYDTWDGQGYVGRPKTSVFVPHLLKLFLV